MRRTIGAACAFVMALTGVACGSSGSSGGGSTVRWYVFEEPSGAFAENAARCNEAAGGRYQVEIVPLPTNADQQRELVVRRLAAQDSDIDLIGMDVIWTAEFAEAGWIREWTGRNAQAITQGTIPATLETARYQDKLWAAPLNSNSQLLWYRKDRVKRAPRTWDEMIEMAEQLPPDERLIQVQSARYEGLTVWFNTLVGSAGGSILNEQLEPELGPPAVRAAEVISKLANSGAADPALSNAREDTGRLAFQSGSSSFMINWPYVYPSAVSEAPDIAKNMAWTNYPSVVEGEPSTPPLGGINLGVSKYSEEPEAAFAAAACLRNAENQRNNATKGGLPPTLEALYSDPAMRETYPFADDLLEGIKNGKPRPVSPAYSDISLAIQQTLHPPDKLDPNAAIPTLEDRLRTVAEGGLF